MPLYDITRYQEEFKRMPSFGKLRRIHSVRYRGVSAVAPSSR